MFGLGVCTRTFLVLGSIDYDRVGLLGLKETRSSAGFGENFA